MKKYQCDKTKYNAQANAKWYFQDCETLLRRKVSLSKNLCPYHGKKVKECTIVIKKYLKTWYNLNLKS